MRNKVLKQRNSNSFFKVKNLFTKFQGIVLFDLKDKYKKIIMIGL